MSTHRGTWSRSTSRPAWTSTSSTSTSSMVLHYSLMFRETQI
uniref:Cyclase n=1 Tax=Arundo donax TaxID=35708 RepID=A0A0A8YV83_ARUDO